MKQKPEWIDKIINQDCVSGMKMIPDNSVELVIADPPYGISRDLNTKGKSIGTTAKLDFNFGVWDVFNKEWFDIAMKKTNGWIVSFCAKKDIGFYWNKLEKAGFVAIDSIVWQKPDPLPLNAKSRFVNAWESIVVGKRKGAYWGGTYEHNILKFQAPKGKERIHPTQKPLGLIKKIIMLTTNTNDLVLDPFMGSGTTAAACIELKRHFVGFEVSKEYFKAANKRLKMSKSNQVFDFTYKN